MYLRRFAYVFLGLTVCITPYLLGADFGTRDVRFAKIETSRPPDQLLRGRTLLVRIQNGAPYNSLPALSSAIVQGMSSDFTAVTADPDLTLTFSVTVYEPAAARTYNDVERTGPGGILTTAVQYWEAHGKLALQVSVTNRSNASLDSFSTKGEYLNKIKTAENGKPIQFQQPSRQQLELELLQN